MAPACLIACLPGSRTVFPHCDAGRGDNPCQAEDPQDELDAERRVYSYVNEWKFVRVLVPVGSTWRRPGRLLTQAHKSTIKEIGPSYCMDKGLVRKEYTAAAASIRDRVHAARSPKVGLLRHAHHAGNKTSIEPVAGQTQITM